MMDWQWIFFSFEGRINRKPFWLCVVALIVISAIANRIDASLFFGYMGAFPVHTGFGVFHTGTGFLHMGAGPISGIVSLLMIWPALAVTAKRWHDRNKSAWWILINFVPVIGWLWALIETGFLPGTPGDNRFGPDPLEDDEDYWRD
jgi:uncharacterized membrane protein YhaH (DUF805 family)